MCGAFRPVVMTNQGRQITRLDEAGDGVPGAVTHLIPVKQTDGFVVIRCWRGFAWDPLFAPVEHVRDSAGGRDDGWSPIQAFGGHPRVAMLSSMRVGPQNVLLVWPPGAGVCGHEPFGT